MELDAEQVRGILDQCVVMSAEPAYANTVLSTRLIALAARRRGWAVDALRHTPGVGATTLEVIPSDSTLRLYFRGSMSQSTSAVSFLHADHKAWTQFFLNRAEVTTPASCFLSTPAHPGDANRAEAFLCAQQRLVVKPVCGRGGMGISCNVTDTLALQKGILEAQAAPGGEQGVLLQAMVVDGQDLRFLVIADEVVCVNWRDPAKVIGDGFSTVAELIALQHPTLSSMAVAHTDVTIIPLAGARWNLTMVPNLLQGGESFDVTDEVHPSLCDLARRATRAVGKSMAGVDIMTVGDWRLPLGECGATVLEVNSRPGLRIHYTPRGGRDVADLLLTAAYSAVTCLAKTNGVR
jgi:cyanophycin synthetase